MAKTRSRKRRIGIRDRLGQLTYRAACRLMGDEDGEARLRRGGRFEINLPRDVYLGGDTLRVSVPDPELPAQQAIVTVVEMTNQAQGVAPALRTVPGPLRSHRRRAGHGAGRQTDARTLRASRSLRTDRAPDRRRTAAARSGRSPGAGCRPKR